MLCCTRHLHNVPGEKSAEIVFEFSLEHNGSVTAFALLELTYPIFLPLL